MCDIVVYNTIYTHLLSKICLETWTVGINPFPELGLPNEVLITTHSSKNLVHRYCNVVRLDRA